MRDEHANIMLLGGTGVGKSSFINYLIGDDVCRTGTGAPITQGFEVYEYDISNDDTKDLPLRIYDSKGLEVMDYPAIRQDIITFVKRQCGSENVYQWIHSIFYCVNVKSSRLQPAEVTFVKKLSSEIAQTVHIILTHCKQTPEGLRLSSEMKEYVKCQLGDARIRIYCVNSVTEKTRAGMSPAFGRDKILKQIVELLWSDICHKVAKRYAKEIHYVMVEYVNELQQVDATQIKCISTFDMLLTCTGVSSHEHNVKTMNKTLDKMHSFKVDVKKLAQQIAVTHFAMLEPLVNFCIQYGSVMNQQETIINPKVLLNNPFWEFDWFPRLEPAEEKEVSDNSKVEQLLAEMRSYRNNIEGMTKLKTAQLIANFLVKYKKYLKNLSHTRCQKIRSKIPDEQTIEAKVHAKLMDAYQDNRMETPFK